MEATLRTRTPLPSELLHKILTVVLADSIHAICVSPELSAWDRAVVWILAGTCFTWKEIVRGILVMAFTPDSVNEVPKSDLEVFRDIHSKLTHLRVLGDSSRRSFSSNPSSHIMFMQDLSPLAQSYALYLTSIALRRHVEQMGELNTVALTSIVEALRVARKVCEMVMPRGLSLALVGALEKQILVVEFGTAIAKARIALEAYLSRLSVSSSLIFDEAEDGTELHSLPHEDKEQVQYDIRTEMQNDIQFVENISCPYCTNIDTEAAEVRLFLEMSGIIGTLKKYRGLDLVMEEYDLGRHAGALIERWCKGTSDPEP